MNFSDKALARIQNHLDGCIPWLDKGNVTELPHIQNTVMIPCKDANDAIRRVTVTSLDQLLEELINKLNADKKVISRLRNNLKSALIENKELNKRLDAK